MSDAVQDFNARVRERVNAKLDALKEDIEATLAFIRGPTEEEMRAIEEQEWQDALDKAEASSQTPRAHTMRQWIAEAWPANWRRKNPGWIRKRGRGGR